MAGIKKT